MKKLILSAALVMMTFLTQAATTHVRENVFSGDHDVTILKESKTPSSDAEMTPSCSVSLKGSVDLGPVEAEITCSTTANTCDEATAKAVSCLKSAINLVRSILL